MSGKRMKPYVIEQREIPTWIAHESYDTPDEAAASCSDLNAAWEDQFEFRVVKPGPEAGRS